MGGKGVPALKWQMNVEHATNRRQRHGSMANSALQAVLREAGGVRANLSGAGSAPSSREAFPLSDPGDLEPLAKCRSTS